MPVTIQLLLLDQGPLLQICFSISSFYLVQQLSLYVIWAVVVDLNLYPSFGFDLYPLTFYLIFEFTLT